MSERVDSDVDVPLQELLDIEAIKKMRARCARLLDTKRWEEWGALFTEEAEFHVPDLGLTWEGRATIVQAVSTGMSDVRSVHQLHAPEIELTGAHEARGVWAMFDSLERTSGGGAPEIVAGYGHYVEEYVRENREWRIKSLRLERLRVDG